MIFEADCHLLNYDKHHNKIYEADSKKTRQEVQDLLAWSRVESNFTNQ